MVTEELKKIAKLLESSSIQKEFVGNTIYLSYQLKNYSLKLDKGTLSSLLRIGEKMKLEKKKLKINGFNILQDTEVLLRSNRSTSMTIEYSLIFEKFEGYEKALQNIGYVNK